MAARTFRVFVSSTFSDLKAERNALQAHVFPRLRELCQQHGARFQPIDLRWGVSEEASLDQQAMNICLGEIARCQQVSPRPNFVVLLGDRYGWMPPLAQIPEAEYRQILAQVPGEDRVFLDAWYRLDENAVPPEWRLKPRERSGPYGTYHGWQPVEARLQRTLARAVEQLGFSLERRLAYTASATHQEIQAGALQQQDAPGHVFCFFRHIEGLPISFNMPALQEVLSARLAVEYPRGLSPSGWALVSAVQALDPASSAQQVNHHLQQALERTPVATDEAALLAFIQQVLVDFSARDFINLDETTWAVDQGAYHNLAALKDRLRSEFRQNIYDTREMGDPVYWTGSQPPAASGDYSLISTHHIGTLPGTLAECQPLLAAGYSPGNLCEALFRSLAKVILAELAQPHEGVGEKQKTVLIQPHPALGEEGLAHHAFAEQRLAYFIGRRQILKEIDAHLGSASRRILAIAGRGGTGKSALMAKAIQAAQRAYPQAEIVYRFIGASPDSSDGRGLLGGLCRELSRRYGVDVGDIPSDYRELVPEFSKRMGLASAERPLILFLDSLDQLSTSHSAHNLIWLPAELPEHVSLVTSTRDEGETCQNLRAKPIVEVRLAGLLPEEGEVLLSQWLVSAGRTLQPAQQQEVLDKFVQSDCNPLYLKLAFEEAQLWTSFQPPEALALGVPGIIRDNMIYRLAHEGNHGEVLVFHALGYLAASRYGLAEDELIDLLSRDLQVYQWFFRQTYHLPSDLLQLAAEHLRQHPELLKDLPADLPPEAERLALSWLKQSRTPPDAVVSFLEQVLPRSDGPRLPVVLWSRLSFDLAPYLAERMVDGSALLAFYHRELGDVSQATFLGGDAALRYHENLAAYFRARIDPEEDCSWQGSYPRGLSELPYHLVHARQWESLEATLIDYPFIQQKIEQIGAQALVGDYLEARGNGFYPACLRFVLEALQISTRVLDRFPDQAGGQLYGRLLSSGESKIQKLLQQIVQVNTTPWLRPLNPALAQPSGILKYTILGHLGAVQDLHIKNDGTYACSNGVDGIVRYWDLKAGIEQFDRSVPEISGLQQEIKAQYWFNRPEDPIIPGQEAKFNLYSPDRTRAISVVHRSDFSTGYHYFSHYDINLWSLAPEGGGQPVLIRSVASATKAGSGNGENVWVVAVSPDGRRAAVAGNLNVSGDIDDNDSFLALWDLEAGKTVNYQIFPFKNGPNHLALNEDGSLAVLAFLDGDLKVLDLESSTSGSREGVYLGKQQGDITALAMTPDGRWALSGHSDGIIRVWDLEHQSGEEPLAGHSDELETIEMTLDGRKMVSKSRHAKNISEWSIAEQVSRRELLGSENLINRLTIAPGGKYISTATLDGEIRVWDTLEERELSSFSLAEVSGKKVNHMWKFWFSPNGDALVIHWDTFPQPNFLTIYNLATGGQVRNYEYKPFILKSRISFDRAVHINRDEIQVWDLNKGKPIKVIPVDAKLSTGAYMEPDNWKYWVEQYITTNGEWVALRADRENIHVYDINQGRLKITLSGHQKLISSVAISGNGSRVVSADESGVLKAWDVSSGAELFTISEGVVFAIALDYFGQLACFACEDGRVGVWDLQNGKIIARYTTDGVLTYLAAALESRRLAVGEKSGKVHILDLQNLPTSVPVAIPRREHPRSWVVDCLHCGGPFEIEPTSLGCQVRCPGCGLVIELSPLAGVEQPRQTPPPATAADLRQQGAKLVAAGKLAEALACYDQALKLAPRDLYLLDERIAVLIRLGRSQAAVDSIDFVIDNHIATGISLGNMFGAKGHALFGLGKLEQALDCYRQAIANGSHVRQVWYMQGYVLQELNRFSDAIESYQKAQEIQPEEDTQLLIAYCYFKLADYALAEQGYRGMVEAGSSHPLAYHGLGISLIMLKNYPEAGKWLRRFLQEVRPEYQHLVADVNRLIQEYCPDTR